MSDKELIDNAMKQFQIAQTAIESGMLLISRIGSVFGNEEPASGSASSGILLGEAPVTEITPTVTPLVNPYADTDEMIPVINDDHLDADPYIQDNLSRSCDLRFLWWLADVCVAKLIILRGAHPEGCFDIKYPKKLDGALDKLLFDNLVATALEKLCPDPPGSFEDTMNESEVRIGPDVAQMMGYGIGTKHLQVDQLGRHDFSDPLYSHWHLKIWTKRKVTV